MNNKDWEKEWDKKFGLGDVISRTDMGEEFDGFRYDDDSKQFINSLLAKQKQEQYKRYHKSLKDLQDFCKSSSKELLKMQKKEIIEVVEELLDKYKGDYHEALERVLIRIKQT